MIHELIKEKKNRWLLSDDCAVKDLIAYIESKGQLRDTQVEAIETYLFLKIEGKNKPLWILFCEGFFASQRDLSKLNINEAARQYLTTNIIAYALYDFAIIQQISGLEREIVTHPEILDYESIIKNIFYGVEYADYLLSLPMGAGKTFLMASFIYLDMYFAQKEPLNKSFAHNFLILIPSGLKSSIVPSLRTIRDFDPSWVLPEPFASILKREIKFDILDVQKTAKKSGQVRNPNAQKVNACLPNPFGQVFVVNAEKVILEGFRFNSQARLELDTDDKDTNNDLKRLIGLIPNLSILIDEVHHAATEDIKLRQAVNYWQERGNITTVLGFSGTPYLASAEKIMVSNYTFSFSQITNTVYYYPLVTAIKRFLKTPTVKVGENLTRLQIIRQGIEDFDRQYKGHKYENGTIPKIAIYCSNIEVLEEEVYPFLLGELKLNKEEVLKYHGGNKAYSMPKENELRFRSLDNPDSTDRYVLLVQVGKEGWDCPSLTGVILSQKGDSPQNMVLQTSCRCLRQVDKNTAETALIWLNKDNADILNKQLKQEQNSSIDELNKLKRAQEIHRIERHSRIEHLELPAIDYYQLKVNFQSENTEDDANTKVKLEKILNNIEYYETTASVLTSGIEDIDTAEMEFINNTGLEPADYNQWIFEITKESLGTISQNELQQFRNLLGEIWRNLVLVGKDGIFYNDFIDRYKIQSHVRLAFSLKRTLLTVSEIIPKKAQLLLAERLSPVTANNNLYPNEKEVAEILLMDKSGDSTEIDFAALEEEYNKMKASMEAQGFGSMVPPFAAIKAEKDYTLPVRSKESAFHYLPYNFGDSGSSNLEQEIMKGALMLKDFKEMGLEIYYNGDRHVTEFKISCFAKENKVWKNLGEYTTDFLIIKRNIKNKIHKILMVETNGALYAPDFERKKKFIETGFLNLNKEKFGYDRFDFIYLEDSKKTQDNLYALNQKITTFFKD
jgi:type III restriction enzyme